MELKLMDRGQRCNLMVMGHLMGSVCFEMNLVFGSKQLLSFLLFLLLVQQQFCSMGLLELDRAQLYIPFL